jgi:hypothetical protein
MIVMGTRHRKRQEDYKSIDEQFAAELALKAKDPFEYIFTLSLMGFANLEPKRKRYTQIWNNLRPDKPIPPPKGGATCKQ